MDMEKHPVLLTDRERSWAMKGIRSMVDSVKKEKKGLEGLDLDPEVCDDALEILRGDGVNGGLLLRFAPRGENDMFAARLPAGAVRTLYTRKEDGDWEPVDGEAWTEPEIPVQLAEERLQVEIDASELYYEDADGQVFRLRVRSAIEWEHVGEREEEEIEAAVDAAEAAANGGGGNINALDALPWGSKKAKDLAAEEGLPIEALAGHGTGKGGRLTLTDVRKAIEDRDASEAPDPAEDEWEEPGDDAGWDEGEPEDETDGVH